VHLAEQLSVDHACLWCRRSFYGLEAVRKHMYDKSHCKIAYDTVDQQLEISDHYDFTSSYGDPRTNPRRGSRAQRLPKTTEDEWEDEEGPMDEEAVDEVVEEVDLDEVDGGDPLVTHGDSAFELVLPSGARVGHRSLRRYFVQRFNDPLANISSYANSDAVVVKRLLKDTRSALIPAAGADFGGSGKGMMTIKARSIGAAKEAGRHIREHRDSRRKEDFKTKVGFRSNNQKHFRDQLLQ